MRIKAFFVSIFFLFSVNLFSQIYSSNQLLPSGHWAYDALFMLSNETKRTSFATNAPLSIGEFKLYLSQIPYESLSDNGKLLYDELFMFIEKKVFQLNMGPVFFGFNMNLYPEIQIKSNEELDWSFATDYTGHKNSLKNYNLLSKDEYRSDTNKKWTDGEERSEIQNTVPDYAANSSFFSYSESTPVVTIPLYLGWSDYFLIQTDPCFAKSYWGLSKNNSFTNIVYDSNDMDFLWPRNAYGSAGVHFDSWGVNINFARQGLQIGKTLTGSVIYNSTFETEGYFQLNLYSSRMRYNLDVVEVSTDKYLYVHSIEARPFFNWIRLGIVEATLINKPFELKFLNPIMIMHSYGSWQDSDYYTNDEENFYGEAHVCQYMGIQVELTPFKYSRLYFLYAQNEIQPPNELGSANGKSIPDSFGAQLGLELSFPATKGWWKCALEGVYTTPFCYIKQGASWSLYSERFDMQSHNSYPINSWIGSPFGPDAIGASASVSYSQIKKWNLNLSYLFVAHGTNSFGLFNNTITIDGKEYYAYYPSVLRKMGLITDEEAENIARSYKLTGIVQYTNRITLEGSYNFSEHLSIDSRFAYSFVFNNKNDSGKFSDGIEASVALSYTLFE